MIKDDHDVTDLIQELIATDAALEALWHKCNLLEAQLSDALAGFGAALELALAHARLSGGSDDPARTH